MTTQEINVSCCILVNIIGNLCGLLDSITCDTLYLDTLDDATCDSLLKMLPSRVRKLDLAMRIQDEPLIYGEGRCNAIFFDEVAYRTEFKEILKLWVKLRGGPWTIKDGVESKLRDIIKLITIIFYSKSKDNVKFKPGLYV